MNQTYIKETWINGVPISTTRDALWSERDECWSIFTSPRIGQYVGRVRRYKSLRNMDKMMSQLGYYREGADA